MTKRFGWLGAVVAALALTMHPVTASADDLLNTIVQLAPPLLLNSEQPQAPTDGYIWQPGYWSWGQTGYYWVPGAWVSPPQTGYNWTPGYWSYDTARSGYAWQPGYWDNQVGYYGGVDYGNGYYGNGYVGGRWDGRVYRYNTAVTHVRTTIRNVYIDRRVVNNYFVRTSYNGGNGIHARPTAWQESFARRHHIGMTVQQQHFRDAASRDPHLRYGAVRAHVRPQHTAPRVVHQQHTAPRVVVHEQHAAPRIVHVQHTAPRVVQQHQPRAPQHVPTQHVHPAAPASSSDPHHQKHPPGD